MERQRFLGEFQGVFASFFRGFLQFPVDFPVISRSFPGLFTGKFTVFLPVKTGPPAYTTTKTYETVSGLGLTNP
ncbi:MAG: hypothetical protein EBT57_05505 [Verrucomicrobia bacterium]|nr:hypothetical protein [Verrucomicrobiota bacterium]